MTSEDSRHLKILAVLIKDGHTTFSYLQAAELLKNVTGSGTYPALNRMKDIGLLRHVEMNGDSIPGGIEITDAGYFSHKDLKKDKFRQDVMYGSIFVSVILSIVAIVISVCKS